MPEPPVLNGATHVEVRVVPLTVAVTPVGDPGTFGTVVFGNVLAKDAPVLFTALISKVYSAPLVNPLITIEVSVASAVSFTPEAVIT